MKFVKWFDEINKDDVSIAGGKGANLGEMFQAGFPVPPGFVVTSNAYFTFLKENDLNDLIKEILIDIDVDDTDLLEGAAQRIQDLIRSGEIPNEIRKQITYFYKKLNIKEGKEQFVAVRSSATAEDLPTASFAGQQKTFLNVKGEGDVLQAVKEAWASLFEARAIFYRAKKGFDHLKVGLAAVVQKMVFSDKAGVMFTVDPISQNENILTIDAGLGLGEAVVSGMITPDNYKVDKKTMKIMSKSISKQKVMVIRKEDGGTETINVPANLQEKQKISDEHVKQLAEIGIKIEKHYKKPQDIEWAIEGNKIYIVQSRAITTLTKKKNKEEVEIIKENKQEELNKNDKNTENEEILLTGIPASPGVVSGKVRIITSLDKLGTIKSGEILVAKMTSPDYVPAMKKAKAIITDEGGLTSHAAIVSRELGIPAIVGTEKATEILKDGVVITVDATKGIVYKGAKKEEEYIEKPHEIVMNEIITGTKIYLNLGEPSMAQKYAKLPCDGIGLMRAEFILSDIGKHPKLFIEEHKEQEFIDTLAEKIRSIVSPFYPRPVVYRATDFKSNEYRNLKGGEKYEVQENNPMIGYRGASRYIMEPDVFKMELRAIKKVREEFKLKNLYLMIPFVRRVGELKAIKEMMNEVGLYRTKDFKLWIMVEVPSTVLLLDKFIDVGIDGVSIGTNDLTQLILGIDRDSRILGREFDERNEAVLKAIQMVIQTARQRGITVSLCGQAPSVYPNFAEKLVEFGITSISVNPDAFYRVKRIVASAEQKLLLDKIRKI